MLAAKSEPVIVGVLSFLPFTLGPHAVTHFGVLRAKSKRSQFILLLAMLSYMAWFVFLYVDIFYLNPDPQSPIALLFVGAYALPVLAVLWFAAQRAEKKSKAA